MYGEAASAERRIIRGGGSGGRGPALTVVFEARTMAACGAFAAVEPRGRAARVPTPAKPKAAIPMSSDRASLSVLVVDDDPVSRRILTLLLEPLGAAVVLAEDGREALERAAVQAFDVILMDVRMPRMDGPTTTRRLRAAGGPNRCVPVVAVTGVDAPEEVSDCLDAGMSAWVAKPLEADTLYAAIAGCLIEADTGPLALSA